MFSLLPELRGACSGLRSKTHHKAAILLQFSNELVALNDVVALGNGTKMRYDPNFR